MRILTTVALITAALGCAAAPARATTIAAASATVNSGSFANANATSVGRNSADNSNFRGFAAFQVSDILANEGLTIGDLATSQFELSFDTGSGVTMTSGAYRADYVGFYANSIFPASGLGASGIGDWNAMYAAYSVGAEINSGVTDTAGAQSLTIGGFLLSGVTEGDANDYVVFGVRYDEPQAANTNQSLVNFSLALAQQAASVPEPSTVALLALGAIGLGLARRRPANRNRG